MAHSTPKYSVIVPVYNRPQEVDELLASLCHQQFTDFEVIVVEDGSSVPCKEVIDRYARQLVIHYFFKTNSGPGPSRNVGFEK
jgi:glycosyltransferase involved in cell wall biosynthesis